MTTHPGRQALVTGIGLVTPLGLEREATWEGLTAGRSGIREISRFDASSFPCRIAGEIRGLDPAAVVGKRDAQTLDPFQIYALTSALEAIADAAIDISAMPKRVAVCFGVGLGGIGSMETNHRALIDRGPRRVSPFLVPMMIPNMAASLVSIRVGALGPCEAVSTACAAGAHALALARLWIESGVADVVIAGGTEAAVTPLSLAGFCSMRALSRRNDVPQKACRPFDSQRDGFVLAEGAAAVVLESAELVRKRRAHVYAELAGSGSTADASHITQPDPHGDGQARCIEQALAAAHLVPSAVEYINAHGTGTHHNDRAETIALKRALGDDVVRKIPVSSTKSMTGHLLGAAGALEAALCALVIDREMIPPTINLEDPDPQCELNHVVGAARPRAVEVALSNSFGFGGTNATLVLRRWHSRGKRT